MAKEILIISNYFPPEKGAAPNRINTLARGLSSSGYAVKVICPLPNYPNGKIDTYYRRKIYSKKAINNLTTYRLWLFASNSRNKFVRLFSMLSFAFSLVIFLLFNRTPKKVIIQCSPLFVGFAGVLISHLQRKTILLNISDIWPLAGLEMGLLSKGFYYTLLKKIEYYNYKKADLILGQSKEIISHVSTIFPDKQTFLYRNYPLFKAPISTTSNAVTGAKELNIVYAGLLGVAQGVAALCKELQLPKNVSFHIYGNGPEAHLVERYAKQKERIYYHGILERAALHTKLQSYDLTIIPLVQRIYGSVPSKIFEYAKLGLPILYFSEGEGSELVKEHHLGWVIKDGDYNSLNALILKLSAAKTMIPDSDKIRKTADDKFNINRQFEQLLNEIELI